MEGRRCVPAGLCCTVLFCLTFLLYTGGQKLMAQDNGSSSLCQADEVRQLIAILRNKDLRDNEPKLIVETVEKLGRLRAEAAIKDLVDLLAFSRRFDWEREDMINEIRLITPGDRYPAVSALFQIGKTALPALVQVISDNEIDSLEFRNARFVVMSIFRDDLPAGSAYLREEAKQFPSPAAQARLWAAAQWIDDLHAKLKAEHQDRK